MYSFVTKSDLALSCSTLFEKSLVITFLATSFELCVFSIFGDVSISDTDVN